jgi:hypothetical protein
LHESRSLALYRSFFPFNLCKGFFVQIFWWPSFVGALLLLRNFAPQELRGNKCMSQQELHVFHNIFGVKNFLGYFVQQQHANLFHWFHWGTIKVSAIQDSICCTVWL